MSTVTISLDLCAMITDVINTDYNIAVADATSYLLVILFWHASAQILPLVVLYRFSFDNIIDSKRSHFLCGDKSIGKTGLKVSCIYICYISVRGDFSFFSKFKLSC